ncbi:sensor histidine kinase [Kitasatospora sp. NPDC089509]|uniref:sensor histidine kinase n=1 Tax=Kitasatospora sp. NPDC089509 TaxID=3364079 RepID=UPI0038278CF1
MLPQWATDVLLSSAALVDALVKALKVHDIEGDWPYTGLYLDLTATLLGSTAALALLLRRRQPTLVFALILLVVLVTEGYNMLAMLVILYTLAERSLHRALVGAPLYVAVTTLYVCYQQATLPSELLPTPLFCVYQLTSSVIAACAAVSLGRLVSNRRELARSLAELHDAQEHQRELHAQAALARERVQLAREMHDMVSHQVSLIAVQAGALQVGASCDDTEQAARTIRKLSVATLDELRHMVTLLRASGGRDTEITQKLTGKQLADLVAGSSLDARLLGTMPDDASPAVQRAVYRIVQEALTNIRKHAPGASALVEIQQPGAGLEVTVTNTPATRPRLQLPGSQAGVIGLRERAESLRGTLTYGPTPDNGYRIHVVLPDRKH